LRETTSISSRTQATSSDLTWSSRGDTAPVPARSSMSTPSKLHVAATAGAIPAGSEQAREALAPAGLTVAPEEDRTTLGQLAPRSGVRADRRAARLPGGAMVVLRMHR
jgi:hypothetical protein